MSFIGVTYRNISEGFLRRKDRTQKTTASPKPTWRTAHKSWQSGVHYTTYGQFNRLESVLSPMTNLVSINVFQVDLYSLKWWIFCFNLKCITFYLFIDWWLFGLIPEYYYNGHECVSFGYVSSSEITGIHSSIFTFWRKLIIFNPVV